MLNVNHQYLLKQAIRILPHFSAVSKHDTTSLVSSEIGFSHRTCLPVIIIALSCQCNVDPRTSHFYIVKLGLKGIYIFLIFAVKRRVLEMRQILHVPTIHVLSKNNKIVIFFILKSTFLQHLKIAIGMFA